MKKKKNGNNHFETRKQVIRVAGRLKEILTVIDKEGNVLHKIISPLMVELLPRGVVQIMLGASILAIPVGFTEEVWTLGATLPLYNLFGVFVLSILFISIFVYYNSYRGHMEEHWDEFFKRVLATYFISFLIVALILSLIQQAPWQVDAFLAIKRIVLVTLPASMTAAVADMIK